MYRALDIAKYVIQNSSVSNLKLQKILYFIQAEFLVTKGVPCFEEEIVAWEFGPTVMEVYYEYRVFGSSTILFSQEEMNSTLLKEDKELVDEVIKELEDYSASDLTQITIRQTPHINAKRRLDNTITHDDLIEFFSEEE